MRSAKHRPEFAIEFMSLRAGPIGLQIHAHGRTPLRKRKQRKNFIHVDRASHDSRRTQPRSHAS